MAPKSDEKPVELMAESESKDKDTKSKSNKKKDKKNNDIIDDENAMSEEDRELKERLDECVSTLINENNEESVTTPIRLTALDVIVTELRNATSSMTSVPKPLKFLRPKFDILKEYYGSIESNKSVEGDKEMVFLRARVADVLAVLAMTLGKHGKFMFFICCGCGSIVCLLYISNQPYPTPIKIYTQTDERESLNFKLKGTKDYNLAISLGSTTAKAENDLGSWGHEFIRSLAGEIGQEYNARVIAGSDPETDEPFADLLGMVDVIVPFNVSHHAEAEAVDLLIEVQRLKKILELDSIDEGNYRRVCMYLIKTADFMSDPDDYAVSFIWV